MRLCLLQLVKRVSYIELRQKIILIYIMMYEAIKSGRYLTKFQKNILILPFTLRVKMARSKRRLISLFLSTASHCSRLQYNHHRENVINGDVAIMLETTTLNTEKKDLNLHSQNTTALDSNIL